MLGAFFVATCDTPTVLLCLGEREREKKKNNSYIHSVSPHVVSASGALQGGAKPTFVEGPLLLLLPLHRKQPSDISNDKSGVVNFKDVAALAASKPASQKARERKTR